MPTLNPLVVNVPGAEAADHSRRYQADSQVKSVEADPQRKAAGGTSDPAYANQWALPKIGWENAYGTVDPADPSTIAVLDTGVASFRPLRATGRRHVRLRRQLADQRPERPR